MSNLLDEDIQALIERIDEAERLHEEANALRLHLAGELKQDVDRYVSTMRAFCEHHAATEGARGPWHDAFEVMDDLERVVGVFRETTAAQWAAIEAFLASASAAMDTRITVLEQAREDQQEAADALLIAWTQHAPRA